MLLVEGEAGFRIRIVGISYLLGSSKLLIKGGKNIFQALCEWVDNRP